LAATFYIKMHQKKRAAARALPILAPLHVMTK